MAISSPGVGSNLDVNGIVSKLMQVESQPLTSLQKREASYQAKLTAYGTLKGALSTFQNSLSSLANASTFQTPLATASDSTILNASATSLATQGSYSITVGNLAQAQTISSAGQSSTTTAIGAGTSTTLTFSFGTISDGALVSGVYTGSTFTQDATQASKTVVIDGTNNSLQGIRDAINAANVGVTASIVNDGTVGSPYHLMLTSTNTGLSKSMKITASGGGDASVTSLLSYDPAGTQNLTQTAVAQDASLSINGLSIASSSNAVSSAIPGVTLNLTKAGSTTLNVANNTAGVMSAVQGFVKAYNDINNNLKSLTGYNATTKTGGLLIGDAPTQMIQARLRSTIGAALSGVGSNTITNLTQIGVNFLKDGTLTIDNTKLQSALSSNFSDFASLFAAFGKTTDSLVSYASSTTNTKAGSYAVNVTTLATQGTVVGSDKATQAKLTGNASANLTIGAGVNDRLLVTVDGAAAVQVTLTPGAPYASAAALAAQVQTDINTALAGAGQTGTVSVSESGGVLSITSDKFGAASSVSVTDDPAFPGNTGATDLLGAAPTSSTVTTITAGVNDQLSLTINGTVGTVTLAAGTYTASTLAAQIQSAINGTSAFSTAGITIGVTQSADVLTLTSSIYGSSSVVTVSGGSGATNLFGGAPAATSGVNAAGTINGVAATGSGQFLTGATGDSSEGLKLKIVGGAIGARGTVEFSKGYAYNLNTLLDGVLSSTGPISSSTDNANKIIADLHKQADAWNVRLTALEKRYRAQFTALDKTIGSMTTISSYLAQQLDKLPGSASS